MQTEEWEKDAAEKSYSTSNRRKHSFFTLKNDSQRLPRVGLCCEVLYVVRDLNFPNDVFQVQYRLELAVTLVWKTEWLGPGLSFLSPAVWHALPKVIDCHVKCLGSGPLSSWAIVIPDTNLLKTKSRAGLENIFSHNFLKKMECFNPFKKSFNYRYVHLMKKNLFWWEMVEGKYLSVSGGECLDLWFCLALRKSLIFCFGGWNKKKCSFPFDLKATFSTIEKCSFLSQMKCFVAH